MLVDDSQPTYSVSALLAVHYLFLLWAAMAKLPQGSICASLTPVGLEPERDHHYLLITRKTSAGAG